MVRNHRLVIDTKKYKNKKQSNIYRQPHMRSSLRLKPKTPLQKQQLHKISTILTHLLNLPGSLNFEEPVDWKGLGLLDYPQIIKRPMDLGTINRKLKEKENTYKMVEAVLNDIQLVWDNCKYYNPVESEIYAIADKLELAFRKMVKNYLPYIKITTITSSPQRNVTNEPFTIEYLPNRVGEKISFQQKRALADKMETLSLFHLNKIIKKIQQISPDSFIPIDEENAKIQFDNIETANFQAIQQQLTSMLEQYNYT